MVGCSKKGREMVRDCKNRMIISSNFIRKKKRKISFFRNFFLCIDLNFSIHYHYDAAEFIKGSLVLLKIKKWLRRTKIK